MTVIITLNEKNLTKLLTSDTGAVAREIELLGELVAVTARANASAGTDPASGTLGVVTGRLLGGIQSSHVLHDGENARVISTDAREPRTGFNYPGYHDIGGRDALRGGRFPWLSNALREVFTR